MFSLSWQITALVAGAAAGLRAAGPPDRARLQAITRESYGLNASMNTTMTERFNVAGALLVKLFGRPAEEAASFGDRAGRVRDIGVTSAMYGRMFFVALTLVAALAQALVYGLGGYFALTGRLDAGTVVTLALLLTRLYGPLTALSNVRVDVMSALVSLRPGLRGARPQADDRRQAGRGRRCPPTRARSSSTTCASRYPTADEVSLASLEDVAVLDQAPTQEVLHGVTLPRRAGRSWSRWSARPARARRRSASWCRGSTTSRSGAVRVGGRRRAGRHAGSRCAPRSASSPRTRTCSTTRSGPTCVYARPDATEDELWSALARGADRRPGRRAAGRAGHRGRRPRLPAVRRREAAAGDRPAAAQGAGDRDPRRGHRAPGLASPRLAVQRALAAALDGPHLAGDRPPAVHRAAAPTRSWWSTAAGSSRPARTPSCSPPAGSTPSSTAPSSSARRRRRRRRQPVAAERR